MEIYTLVKTKGKRENGRTFRLEGLPKRFPQCSHAYFLDPSSRASSSSGGGFEDVYLRPASARVLRRMPWEREEEEAWTRPAEEGRKTSNE